MEALKERVREPRVLEAMGGRYITECWDWGVVYKWLAVKLLIECPCGEVWILAEPHTSCPNCEADQKEMLTREQLIVKRQKAHPWNESNRPALPY